MTAHAGQSFNGIHSNDSICLSTESGKKKNKKLIPSFPQTVTTVFFDWLVA